MNFTNQELDVMSYYDRVSDGSRDGMLKQLRRMKDCLEEGSGLREVIESVLAKAEKIDDREYADLDLNPEYTLLLGVN